MQVTKNITLDLLETGSPVIIKAKQNDRNTRYIAAHLYVDGLAYPVPSGTEIAFRYKKPDGTAGFYDALPNNSPAITISGNTVTVELVEQVLTVAGCVHCEINMYNAASEKLTTFTFEISVEESVLTDAEIISSDYYNVLTAEIAKALQAVTDATEQAENAAQSAQEAADSAAMSKDWAAGQPVTYSGTPVSIAYAGAQRIASITAYGENAQGGTTEAPVALTGVDSVQVCGNNLLPMATEAKTIYGVTFTPNSDGSVTIKGTATGWSSMVIDGDFSLPAGTYTLNSNTQTTDVGLSISKDVGGTQNIATSSTTSKTFTLPDLIKHYVAYIVVRPNSVVNTTIYPMLNLGESPLPYETYQGNVTPLPIPRPLHKVGDVRDSCVTRVKSVYDKRIVLDGTENWKKRTDISITGGSCFYPNNFVNDAISNAPVVASAYFVGRVSPTINLWDMRQVGTNVGIQFNAPFAEVSDFTAWLAEHPLTVYYQSTAYDGTNGLDVCLTEYQTDFVELDGTEVWAGYARISTVSGNFYEMPIPKKPEASNVQVTGTLSSHLTCDNAYTKKVDCVWAFVNTQSALSTLRIGFSDDSIDTAEKVNAYLAAQKAAGTPVQVAYQLAAPEVYATDPVDIDNAAGPLTVMTGGELEVRMTELVGSRSDVSNNTVAFSEAAQDADIQTGEELTVLFGKIKKRFSVVNKLVNGAVYPNLLDNSDFTNLVNQRGEAVYDYLTGIGYGPDRWQLVEAKYTLASQTVTSAGSSHTYGSQLRQIIPLEKIKIGDTVTASISTESGILNGTAKLELKIDTSVSDLPYVIEQDWGGVKIGCIKENVCHVIVFLKENKSVKINWVKLEKGSVATPYVPKGYGAELSECLRFYYQVASVRTFGQQHTGAGTYVNIILPQVMRVSPTMSAPGEWTIRFNGMDKKATVSSVNSLTGNTLNLTMSTIAGGTYIGPLYAFYDGKITFSADL